MRPLLLLLVLVPAVALPQDFGPIQTRNHRALSLAFLRFEPHIGLLPAGEQSLSVGFTVANDFRRLPEAGVVTVDEDTEVERVVLDYRRGIGHQSELAVALPLMSRGGGFLDPMIDWWHANILHWSDQSRNSTPFGRSIVRVPGSRGFGSAFGIGDVSLTLNRRLSERWVVSAGLKLPTGDAEQLLGSGGVDAGLYLQGNAPLNSRWKLHGQVGAIVQGRATALGHARPLVHQEGLALTYEANSRDTYIAQWQGEASALRTGVPGSDATHRVITFGYRRRLSSTQTLEGFFSEDRDLFNGRFPEGANIGPDFTAGLRWTTRL